MKGLDYLLCRKLAFEESGERFGGERRIWRSGKAEERQPRAGWGDGVYRARRPG